MKEILSELLAYIITLRSATDKIVFRFKSYFFTGLKKLCGWVLMASLILAIVRSVKLDFRDSTR